jgi:hypothetical protein
VCAVVQLLAQRAGRGPAEVRSEWAGDDAVLVLLGDGLTTAERTLWNYGRSQAARAYREAGVMAEVFLLEPLGGSDSSDAGSGDAGGRPASPDLPPAAVA